MGYTCKDCKVQCMERSREYICTSFKLSDEAGEPTRAVERVKSKSNRQKSKAAKTAAQNV